MKPSKKETVITSAVGNKKYLFFKKRDSKEELS
jgi:hypothetical protein